MSGKGTRKKFDRAAHCRRIAAKGGKATVAKYGKEHMSAIGKKGYVVTTCRYFLGNEHLHNRWLSAAGAHVYWQSTGLPLKRDRDGKAIWPETPPIHPAQTTAVGQRSLFEKRYIRVWDEVAF